jgi:hypothetical protein
VIVADCVKVNKELFADSDSDVNAGNCGGGDSR